ncbi:MAG TPA: AI-2E family transporter [Nitrospirota bacterium]
MSAPSSSFLTRSPLFAVFFFGIFLFLLYQMGRIIDPFLSPLLWTAILTLALHPVYRRLLSRLKGRRGLAAGLMTILTLLLIIGPAVSLLFVLAAQAVDLYQGASTIFQSGRIEELWSRFTSSFLDRLLAHPALAGLDLKGMVMKGVSDITSGLAGQIGGILKNTLILALDIVIMGIALFFFFRDGETFYNTVIGLLPFTKKQKEAMAQKFSDTFRAVINGVFLIALLQGALTGLGFFLFRIPYAIFWGFLAAVLALFPVGGAALVWLPGSLYLFLSGATLRGALLFVWGLVLVTLPDNILKPLIIGKKANIPTFILFIALLGGLRTYGVLGILFGPVVVTLVTVFVQIYREEYTER